MDICELYADDANGDPIRIGSRVTVKQPVDDTVSHTELRSTAVAREYIGIVCGLKPFTGWDTIQVRPDGKPYAREVKASWCTIIKSDPNVQMRNLRMFEISNRLDGHSVIIIAASPRDAWSILKDGFDLSHFDSIVEVPYGKPGVIFEAHEGLYTGIDYFDNVEETSIDGRIVYIHELDNVVVTNKETN